MDVGTVDIALGVVLVALLVGFSLEFKKSYANGIHSAARHPALRVLAGAAVVALGTRHPLLWLLARLVVCFSVADVHLLSSFSL
jgi:hypothetical protein